MSFRLGIGLRLSGIRKSVASIIRGLIDADGKTFIDADGKTFITAD